MNGPTFAQPTAPGVAPRPTPPRPATPARPGPKPDSDGGGLRVLTYLRLHWLMILFCGTLLGAVGSYAAWELLASNTSPTRCPRFRACHRVSAIRTTRIK